MVCILRLRYSRATKTDWTEIFIRFLEIFIPHDFRRFARAKRVVYLNLKDKDVIATFKWVEMYAR